MTTILDTMDLCREINEFLAIELFIKKVEIKYTKMILLLFWGHIPQ